MKFDNKLSLRLLLVILLVCFQIGLFLHYGQHQKRCPNYECYAENHEQYIGEVDRVGGTVVDTSPVTIRMDYAPGKAFELKVTDFEKNVSSGASVRVYGQLKPNYTIQAHDSIVHQVANKRYMYGISFVAMVFVAILGLRYWRFDTNEFVFKRRGE